MDTIAEIKSRVGRLVAEKGLSYNSISVKLGKNQTYLQKFVKEKSPKRLDEDFRRKLAELLEVDEQELTDIKLTAKEQPQTSFEFDEKLLIEIITEIEKYTECNSKKYAPEHKARLINIIYKELSSEKSENSQQTIRQLIRMFDYCSKEIQEM